MNLVRTMSSKNPDRVLSLMCDVVGTVSCSLHGLGEIWIPTTRCHYLHVFQMENDDSVVLDMLFRAARWPRSTAHILFSDWLSSREAIPRNARASHSTLSASDC